MHKLSTKLAKNFQRFSMFDLDWLETNILCQLDVSSHDNQPPALVLIALVITKNVLMSLFLCLLFAFLDHVIIS